MGLGIGLVDSLEECLLHGLAELLDRRVCSCLLMLSSLRSGVGEAGQGGK